MDIGTAWVEGQLESTLAVGEDADGHHDVFACQCCLSFEVEQDSHVVAIVGGIETSDIDQALTGAVSIVCSVECWPSIISDSVWLATNHAFDIADLWCSECSGNEDEMQPEHSRESRN